MYTGPHIIKDGLVFGYDTGYGIADNDTATRFYPGQPTTNIVPLSLSNSSWFNEYSSGRTLRSETLFGQPAYEFKSNDGQIWISPFAFNSYDRSTNDLTLSVYAKNIGSSAVSMNTYFGGDYSSDSLGNGNTKSLPADNTWRRYSWTRFSSAMSANYLEFRTANTGVVISCPQLEIGRVVTPVVNGTRSSTASLIDLKRTTSIDIDVSNVSFDSTGQPDFDGSNDNINFGNIAALQNLSTGAIEIVYHRDASTGTYQMIFSDAGSDFEVTYLGNTLQFYIGNSGISYAHSVTGKFFHLVGIWGTGYKKLYLNGSLVVSGTNTGVDTGSRTRYVGGRGTNFPFNGKIPVTKIYNTALTATEVEQNYNAYKNRFDI